MNKRTEITNYRNKIARNHEKIEHIRKKMAISHDDYIMKKGF